MLVQELAQGSLVGPCRPPRPAGGDAAVLPAQRSRAPRKPYARSIIYFPPQIGSRLTRDAFDDAVVFRVLQRELGLRIDNVRLTVWAELATAEDAASLGCEAGAALLVSQLLYQDEAGRPIELAYSRSLATEARLSTTLSTARRHP